MDKAMVLKVIEQLKSNPVVVKATVLETGRVYEGKISPRSTNIDEYSERANVGIYLEGQFCTYVAFASYDGFAYDGTTLTLVDNRICETVEFEVELDLYDGEALLDSKIFEVSREAKQVSTESLFSKGGTVSETLAQKAIDEMGTDVKVVKVMVANRHMATLDDAIAYCDSCDFDYDCITIERNLEFDEMKRKILNYARGAK